MIDYQKLPDGFSVNEMKSGNHRCPCCGQQTYLRPIDLSGLLVYALRVIADRSAEGAVTTGNDMARHGRTVYCNYSQLKYWGLIVEDRTAGGWRITEAGANFLAGGTTLPSRLWIFADQVRDVDIDNQVEPWARHANSIGIGDVKPHHPKSRQEARERMVGMEHDEA